MGLTVNTNMASMNALNNLNSTNRSLSGSYERISSGLRITKAGDDGAGLGVAENLQSTQRSMRQAIRNTNDGISLIHTAEGAANEVGGILKRMRELAVQSSSETLGDTERGYVNSEFTELSAEVDRISAVTEFNGVKIADGTNTSIDVQVGVNDTLADRIAISLGDLSATTLGVDTASIDLSTVTGAQASLSVLDSAIDSVNSYRADFGAAENRLSSAMRNAETYTENMAGAESQIRDADFAMETADMAKKQIMQQAGVAVLSQANQMNQSALRLIG